MAVVFLFFAIHMHTMTAGSHFRYLPVRPIQREWGLFLTDCGEASIVPGASYPPAGHPSAYAFDWAGGRTLKEYQVIYLLRGRGVFEAKDIPRLKVGAGDLIVLFPGVWHRYAPDPKTGWDENWAGFGGTLAESLVRPPFFSPDRPVLRVGNDEMLKLCLRQLCADVERDPVGAPLSCAGRVVEILGRVQERILQVGSDRRMVGIMHEAQNRILKRAIEPIYFDRLARELGMSYSTFLRGFKRETGISPVQFQNEIRINRAQELLANTDLSVSEIAVQTGFDTVYYFCRVFKHKTGITPKTYRCCTREMACPVVGALSSVPAAPTRRMGRQRLSSANGSSRR